MRQRGLFFWLLASVGLNAILAALWLSTPPASAPLRVIAPVIRPSVTNILRPVRTNLILQPHILSWRDIESTNFINYVANLRGIGCPESTIRDIIVADINQLFARRRATEVVTPEQQWWRADPAEEVLDTALERLEALDTERRTMLTALLGPDWDTAERHFDAPSPRSNLDGPVLGELSDSARQAVWSIESRDRRRWQEIVATAEREGRTIDPAEEVRFRDRTREELAGVLTPAQLEEYELRHSRVAGQLREALRGFDATPDEFRSLFRASGPLAAELNQLEGREDVTSVKRRQELETALGLATREALGAGRFELYRLSRDIGFRQARQTVEGLGAAPEVVLPLYELNRMAEQERRRVMENPALSPEDQSRELANLQEQRLESLRALLGDEAFRKLQAEAPTQ